ncbi:NAD(P)/FAD-dependent oxidoreductase [Rhizobium rhizogenes]|uniref:flavin-containing monooxygenase n=1 Tax=Rhizobium rhizogenes TaxID=359 RepID=UPI00157442C9|nr:NAD(P)/FAD-dependent oxidoreductase [Rhizobium rhizogenes]NTI23616.1 NAD(P)/FAD-dependent oxidoreductase [Rhizobium rhizogenes]QTG08603.1 NAD(P)/FAD-dependent oxidoreductase [Rhizobium rhizogenes]
MTDDRPTQAQLDDSPRLHQKYLRERDKRLRPDGNDQYITVSGQFEHFRDDINASSVYPRNRIERNVEVLVIGGGFSGIVTAARLRAKGVRDLIIIDKASDFGGTWYWNRYPGARCDTESYIYLPLLEETGYIPTEKYVTGQEIFEYTRLLARHFDLYDAAIFQTEAQELRWEESLGRWIVSTDRGDILRPRFLCICSGVLNRPKLPGIPGITSFQGRSFHTTRWDYNYTATDLGGLRDKTVGIIGTGSTSVQVVPHLGASSKKLYVFQRTPPAVDVRNNMKTNPEWFANLQPGWQRRRMDSFDLMLVGKPAEEDFINDGWTTLFTRMWNTNGPNNGTLPPNERMKVVDLERQERIRTRIDAIVKDQKTADELKPWYGTFCKRQVFHDEYLETFNQSNVHLVDTNGKGGERIIPEGLIVAGKKYELDCLIYATGFEVTNDWCHSAAFEIYGRGGIRLTDYWQAGFRTFLGIYVNQFPNLFIVSGPHSGRSVNFTTSLDEQARHVSTIVEYCLKQNIRTIATSSDSEERWMYHMRNEVEPGITSLFSPDYFLDCTPGYHNNEGNLDSPKSTFFSGYPGGPFQYRNVLKAWSKNLIGKDLIVST